ncbi:MAG: GLPGLI family protein [Prevotella sp.]|nr:GLPGLI family protein [Prevotella sp.]
MLFSYYDVKMDEQYYKNYPVPGITTVITRMVHPGSFYAYEEASAEPDWQLEECDSIVCGYPCAKATTTIRGRTWHVWYTLDIPFSEGPWRLCGLPGLILKATDSTGDFDFTVITVEEEHSDYEEENKVTIQNSKLTMFTPLRYEQLLRLYYDNIIQYHTVLSGARIAEQLVQGQAKMGVPLIPEHKTPCLIEYYGDKTE